MVFFPRLADFICFSIPPCFTFLYHCIVHSTLLLCSACLVPKNGVSFPFGGQILLRLQNTHSTWLKIEIQLGSTGSQVKAEQRITLDSHFLVLCWYSSDVKLCLRRYFVFDIVWKSDNSSGLASSWYKLSYFHMGLGDVRRYCLLPFDLPCNINVKPTISNHKGCHL